MAGTEARTDDIPIEAFVGRETNHLLTISPGGEYIALIAAQEEQDHLVVLARENLRVISKSNVSDGGRVGKYYWVIDDRLVFEDLPRRNVGRGWVNYGELYAIDADGSNARLLFGYSIPDPTGSARPKRRALWNSRLERRKSMRAWAEVLSLRADDPDVVTIAAYPYAEEHATPWIYDIDIHTGALSTRGRSVDGAVSLIADERGLARCALVPGDGVTVQLYYRHSEAAGWTLLDTYDVLAGAVLPKICPSNGRVYAYDDRGQLTTGLIELDPGTGESRLLHRDPDFDIAAVIGTPDGSGIAALRYEYPEPRFVTIDESSPTAGALQALQEAFPHQVVDIVSQTRDGRRAMVYTYGPRNPGDYYLYDFETKHASYLMSLREQIDPQTLGEVTRVLIDTADGSRVHGYLTEPPDKGEGRTPLVIMLHDGPTPSRFSWVFNPAAQLFASRGYAVLRLNHRGSSGFGLKYRGEDAVDGILEELLAAGSWAVEHGNADPEQIAVLGYGFGGLLALMSTTGEDTPFACALVSSGVFDLEHLVHTTYRDNEYYTRVLGSDRETLRRQSPLWRTADLHVPVFVAHGELASRPVGHARNFIEALRETDVPVESHIGSGQRDRFVGTEARVELHAHMLEFLDEHCGAQHDSP